MPEILTLKRLGKEDAAEALTWVDLDGRSGESAEWLTSQSGLSEQVVARLLHPTTLNLHESINGGLLLRFPSRTIVPTGGESESTSIRFWIEENRVITLWFDRVPVLEELKSTAPSRQGGWTPFEILTALINRHVNELESTIVLVSSQADDLEDQLLDSDEETDTEDLDNVRRAIIRTRRHLVTLRNLLVFIVSDQSLAISSDERQVLEATTSRVRNHLEIVDDCHERAHLLSDQLQAQSDAKLSRITHNLTIVATVFLPMSFLTGLLGMNVAGIPDEHNPLGFATVCSTMVLIAFGSWIFLRWKKWI